MIHKVTPKFPSKRGMQQGHAISSKLFTTTLRDIFTTDFEKMGANNSKTFEKKKYRVGDQCCI